MMSREWTSKQALVLMTLCLFGGIAGGWLIRGSQAATENVSARAAATASPASANAGTETPNTTQLKEQADAQAAPLLSKLKADPTNPDLLISIGNLYYDAQQYPIAVDYYGRALTLTPSNVAVRTDMGTAYWYMGNADAAIAEFNKALTFAPDNPNTLFNLGLVKWRGKHDGAGAIGDWKKLLAANPNYEARDKVEQMLNEVQKELASTAGSKR
jgi:cytochrome c-type biogenesis protein CcmH/NrfG